MKIKGIMTIQYDEIARVTCKEIKNREKWMKMNRNMDALFTTRWIPFRFYFINQEDRLI